MHPIPCDAESVKMTGMRQRRTRRIAPQSLQQAFMELIVAVSSGQMLVHPLPKCVESTLRYMKELSRLENKSNWFVSAKRRVQMLEKKPATLSSFAEIVQENVRTHCTHPFALQYLKALSSIQKPCRNDGCGVSKQESIGTLQKTL